MLKSVSGSKQLTNELAADSSLANRKDELSEHYMSV